MLLSIVVVAVGIFLVTIDGSHEKVLCFFCYILWRDIFSSIIADMMFDCFVLVLLCHKLFFKDVIVMQK